jgi:hypothetical protein
MMSRSFMKDVFDEVISGNTPQYTAQEDDDVLGMADQLSLQIHVTNATGSGPTLTVKLWGSSDGGKNWVTVSTLWSGVVLSAGTIYDNVVDTGSAVLPGYLKLEIQMAGTTPSAYVKISATGRASIMEMSSSSRTRAPLHGTHYGLGVDEVGPHLLKTGQKPGTRTLVYIHNHKTMTSAPGVPHDPLSRYSLAILTNGDPNSTSEEKDAWPGIEDLKDALVNALSALIVGPTPPWDGHNLYDQLLAG